MVRDAPCCLAPAGFRPFSCCPHFLMAWFGAPSAQSTVPGWICTGCRNLLGLLGSRSVARRVNFYMKHLVVNKDPVRVRLRTRCVLLQLLSCFVHVLWPWIGSKPSGKDFRRMVHFRLHSRPSRMPRQPGVISASASLLLMCGSRPRCCNLPGCQNHLPPSGGADFLTPCGAELGSHLTTMVCGMHFCTPFLVMWHVRFDCISTTQYQARPRVLRSGVVRRQFTFSKISFLHCA